MTRGVSAVAVVALVSAAACDSPDKAGRQSLSSAAEQSGPKLPLAALNALDAGNAEYRAKNYSEAMAKYREATLAAPEHAAPWFGLYMVASEVKNTAILADGSIALLAKRQDVRRSVFDVEVGVHRWLVRHQA